MRQRLQDIYNRAMDRWKGFDRTAKIKLVMTVLTAVIAISALIILLMRPKMVTIHDNLNYTTAGEISNALSGQGISSKTIMNSTAIQVAEKDADRALQYLALNDIPTGSKFDFATAYAYMGMGTTESVKQEVLKLVAESGLEEKLKKFDGVSDATVTLTQSDSDKYFLKTEPRAKASVQLFTNRVFSKNEATGIARYLSKSVQNLAMEDIVIMNGKFETIYSGTEQGAAGDIGSQEELRLLRTQEIENKVMMVLTPQYDDVRTMATVRLNFDKYSESSKTYSSPTNDPDAGLIINDHTSKSSVEGTALDGEPGTGTNSNTTPSYNTGSDGAYSGTTSERDVNYAINEYSKQSETAIGEVDFDNSSLLITLYNYKTYSEQDMINDRMLDGTTWSQFKESIPQLTNLEVDPNLVEHLRLGTGIRNISVLAYEKPVFIDRVIEPLKIEQIVMFAILALLILLLVFGLIRKTQPDEITEIEPELSVEDLLVSTQMEDEKIAEAEKLQEIAFNQDSEAKRQIEKFVQEKPEAVAQLLRNWLNDEWGE